MTVSVFQTTAWYADGLRVVKMRTAHDVRLLLVLFSYEPSASVPEDGLNLRLQTKFDLGVICRDAESQSGEDLVGETAAPSTSPSTSTMKAASLLPLFALPVVLAVPATEQIVLGGVEAIAGAIGGPLVDIAESVKHVLDDVFSKEKVTKWVDDGKEFIAKNGLTCECAILVDRGRLTGRRRAGVPPCARAAPAAFHRARSLRCIGAAILGVS